MYSGRTYVIEIDFSKWAFGFAGKEEMQDLGMGNGFQVHLGPMIITFHIEEW